MSTWIVCAAHVANNRKHSSGATRNAIRLFKLHSCAYRRLLIVNGNAAGRAKNDLNATRLDFMQERFQLLRQRPGKRQRLPASRMLQAQRSCMQKVPWQ
jgi:hypothetical protein